MAFLSLDFHTYLFGTQIHLLQPSSRYLSEIHCLSDLPLACSYLCLIHCVVFGGLNHSVGPGYLLHYSGKSHNPLLEDPIMGLGDITTFCIGLMLDFFSHCSICLLTSLYLSYRMYFYCLVQKIFKVGAIST